MYKCEICGRESFKKIRLGGYTLCSKHTQQYRKYGYFLDNISRTQKDLNDYVINGNEVIFNLYSGTTSEKIGEFIIDLEDIEKVKYHKWRLCHSYIVTGLSAKRTQRELSWVVLDLDNRDEKNKDIVVDHIDGNPRNNKKSNLRICSQGENLLNKSFMSNNTSGFIGVSYRKDRNRYDPEIRLQGKRCHLGYTKTLEEAVYKRHFAKTLLFKEFSNEEQNEKEKELTNSLSPETKKELEEIVLKKLKDKNLWQ